MHVLTATDQVVPQQLPSSPLFWSCWRPLHRANTLGQFLLVLGLIVGMTPLLRAEAPVMTSVFSPKASVKIRVGKTETAVRNAMELPNTPFSITTDSDDLVQIQMDDGSYVRVAPGSEVSFSPANNKVSITSGTALVFFPAGSSLHIGNMDVRGNDAVVLLTQDGSGQRILPIRGASAFHGQVVQEGHVAMVQSGKVITDLGATDLNRFKSEAPILIDLPGSPLLSEQVPSPTIGLRATIESRDATARRQDTEIARVRPLEKFFGSNVASQDGVGAVISQIVLAKAENINTAINPGATIQQSVQQEIVSRPPAPPPAAPPVIPPAPVPPPAADPGVLSVLNAGWTLAASGLITDVGSGLTLTPFANTAGIAAYSVDFLTINAAPASFAAFTAAGGKEMQFTSVGSNGAGNGFEFNANINFGSVSLKLTSNSAVVLAGITATGAAGGAGLAGSDGGNIDVTAKTGNITLGAAVTSTGGAGGAAAGVAVPAGAGGKGGSISLVATAGSVVGGVNVTSTGGAGGTAVSGATAATGETAGKGGDAGAITIRSGGAAAASVVLADVTTTGGDAGVLGGAGVRGKTGNGGEGGAITIAGATGSAATAGTVTVSTVQSNGGNGDASIFAKDSIGNGGNGGAINISTAGALTATTPAIGFRSRGGDSAAHTDKDQQVPSAGNGSNITITAGSIPDGVTSQTVGGNGGVTGGTFAQPEFFEKGGIGGNGGNIDVTITGAGAYAPQVISQGGDAGNVALGATYSRVYNGVGGKGGDITFKQTNPAGTLNLLAAGGAQIATRGGNEITSLQGGTSSNGKNINGAVTIDVGNTDLVITSPTAVNNDGNGTAVTYDRAGNGGRGQFISQNSGLVTITSKNLTIDSGGIVNAGGSAVVVNSTGNVVIAGVATPGITTAAIHSTGGTTIAKATTIDFRGADAASPAIWNEIGTVKVDVSTGTGGAVDLRPNSIISSSSAKEQDGTRTPGNVVITGSGLAQANGQLYGVSASPLAVIASGTITATKTSTGSLANVGSVTRQGTPGATGGITSSPGLQSPTYSVAAQGGNAAITGPPVVVVSSTSDIVTFFPPDQFVHSPLTPRPAIAFDDAQHGTAQLTATPVVAAPSSISQLTEPQFVGSDSAVNLVGGALHNFVNLNDPNLNGVGVPDVNPAARHDGVTASLIAVKELPRTGLGGNTVYDNRPAVAPGNTEADVNQTAAPHAAGLPQPSPANTGVVVSNPTAVTISK